MLAQALAGFIGAVLGQAQAQRLAGFVHQPHQVALGKVALQPRDAHRQQAGGVARGQQGGAGARVPGEAAGVPARGTVGR